MSEQTFNLEKAIPYYTGLMQRIHVGAYDEREPDGSYGEDGVEESVDRLDHRAALNGLKFWWHKEEKRYSLEPMTSEEIAVFQAIISSQ